MGSDNKAVVAAFIQANGRDGLAAAIRSFASEDFTWWTPGTGEIQNIILKLADIMHANYDASGVSFILKHIISEGDLVAAEYECTGRLKNGTLYNNHFHTLFILSDGKIRHIREYHDSAYANPIWGPIFGEHIHRD